MERKKVLGIGGRTAARILRHRDESRSRAASGAGPSRRFSVSPLPLTLLAPPNQGLSTPNHDTGPLLLEGRVAHSEYSDGNPSVGPGGDPSELFLPILKEGESRVNVEPDSAGGYSELVCLRHELNRHCGTLEILQLLEDESEATKYAMSRELHPTANGIRNSVDWLEWLGLIERVPGHSQTKPYRLTEQGRALVNSPLRTWPRWLVVRRPVPTRRLRKVAASEPGR